MITTKKITSVKFVAPDGTEHETQVAAEIHHIGYELTAVTTLSVEDNEAVARALVSYKSVFGPLLHVPKKRTPKAAAAPVPASVKPGKSK
jgi:hypothetical protein